MNANFKVIGSTRLGIKPEFTTPEADALTTRPSRLKETFYILSSSSVAIKTEFEYTVELLNEIGPAAIPIRLRLLTLQILLYPMKLKIL